MTKEVLRKKNHFIFDKDRIGAKIYFYRVWSNIYSTLCDAEDKVICCRTSGSSGIKGSKRKKKVPQSVEVIVKGLYPILRLYKITHVHLVIRMRINIYYYTLVRELAYYGINVSSLIVHRRFAFNGSRGRKLRRL